jgi:hypothetical protein
MWALAFLVSFLLHYTAHSAPADAQPSAVSDIPEDYGCLHQRLPYAKNATTTLFVFLSACGPEKEFNQAVLKGFIKGGVRQAVPVPVSEGNATDVSPPPAGAVGADALAPYEGCLCHHEDVKGKPGFWELLCACASEGTFDRALLRAKLHAGKVDNTTAPVNIKKLGDFGGVCARIADDKDSKFWVLGCIAGLEQEWDKLEAEGVLKPEEIVANASNKTHVEYACHCKVYGESVDDSKFQLVHCGCGDLSKVDEILKKSGKIPGEGSANKTAIGGAEGITIDV